MFLQKHSSGRRNVPCKNLLKSLADGNQRPQKRSSLCCSRVDSKPLTGHLFKPSPAGFLFSFPRVTPTTRAKPKPSSSTDPPARSPSLACHGAAAAAAGEAGSEGGAAGEGRRGVLPHGAGGGRRGAAGQPGARRHPPRAGGSTGSPSTSPRPRTSSPSRGPRPRPPSCRGTTPPLASSTHRCAAASALSPPASCSTKCPAGLSLVCVCYGRYD